MIERIGAENFRSYEAASFPLSARTLFFGPNGAGKTTILEAIHLLGTTLSFRTRRDADLVREGASAGRILGLCGNAQEGARREIRFAAGEARSYLLEGAPTARMDLLGGLRVTALLPGDLELVQGPPAARRRFLDLILAQSISGYGGRLLRLRRIERQRARCLFTGATPAPWEDLLAAEAPGILAARGSAAEKLDRFVREIGKTFFGVHKKLTLRLVGPAVLSVPTSEEVRAALLAARAEETRRRRALWTTDRWEVEILLDGRLLARYGSQGEIRSGALALRLASARLLGPGILLVDDVWGELDEVRKEALFGAIIDAPQAVLAAVSEVPFSTKIQGISAFSLPRK